jgi:hypothetical protein
MEDLMTLVGIHRDHELRDPFKVAVDESAESPVVLDSSIP